MRDTALETVSTIYKMLNHLTREDSKRQQGEIKAALTDICDQAVRIALLFRGTKVEYQWMQKDGREFGEADIEVIGYGSFIGARKYRTVFGAVVKGGGVSGRLDEESHILRKAEVLDSL